VDLSGAFGIGWNVGNSVGIRVGGLLALALFKIEGGRLRLEEDDNFPDSDPELELGVGIVDGCDVRCGNFVLCSLWLFWS